MKVGISVRAGSIDPKALTPIPHSSLVTFTFSDHTIGGRWIAQIPHLEMNENPFKAKC